MPERKTELGRNLQRRADACRTIANDLREPESCTTRLSIKASVYEHAAELADATLPETMHTQELPDGWYRLADDDRGPRFRGPDGEQVEINDYGCTGVYIDTEDAVIPVDVLRAFIAALDGKP